MRDDEPRCFGGEDHPTDCFENPYCIRCGEHWITRTPDPEREALWVEYSALLVASRVPGGWNEAERMRARELSAALGLEKK